MPAQCIYVSFGMHAQCIYVSFGMPAQCINVSSGMPALCIYVSFGRLRSRVVSVLCSNALLGLLMVRPRLSCRLPCSQPEIKR